MFEFWRFSTLVQGHLKSVKNFKRIKNFNFYQSEISESNLQEERPLFSLTSALTCRFFGRENQYLIPHQTTATDTEGGGLKFQGNHFGLHTKNPDGWFGPYFKKGKGNKTSLLLWPTAKNRKTHDYPRLLR